MFSVQSICLLGLNFWISWGLHFEHADIYLPPATKLVQGYIFTCVCDSVQGGGLPQCMLGYHSPLARRPPCTVHAGRYGQQAGGMHPTGMQFLLRNICVKFEHQSNWVKVKVRAKWLKPHTSIDLLCLPKEVVPSYGKCWREISHSLNPKGVPESDLAKSWWFFRCWAHYFRTRKTFS